jgi:polysaccharide export outer membrane protein
MAATAADTKSKVNTRTETAQPHNVTNLAEGYVIGTEDVLAINVWKEPEISRSVPVRPDGKISLPLIGEIEVRGLTPKQLQSQLEQQFTHYIAKPEVTVIVQEVKSLKFNILGEVARPGSYTLSRPATVLDAIATAGGFRDFAKQKSIYVLRLKSDGTELRLPFNYKQVIKGHNLDQNIELEPRDTVVVP